MVKKKSRVSDGKAAETPLQLERVLGLSTINNAAFASSATGDVFYAAGCVVVRYNAEENKQKSFFKASRAVACIAVSEDGSLLAVGERGHQPAVSVWDVHANTKIATLTAHKHGVGCLAFSPNGEYLVSVGFKHDKQLVLWDWNNEKKLTTQKLGNKVHSVSFHPSGDFFVTCGDRHLKWWAVMEILDGEAVSLEGKAASIIEDLRTSTFMDVVCGQEDLDSWVFTVSSVGNLCLFNEKKMVEKWIQLDSSTSYCLEVFCAQGTPGLLVIGCSNGVVKCYNPSTLEHIATIPLPAPLIQGNNLAETLPNKAYGACYALRKVAGTKASPVPKLAAIYSDHSLFVWDIEDIFNVVKYRSFVYHRACVWDVLFLENLEDSEELSPISSDSPIDSGSRTSSKKSKLPTGSFITCSADNTIKIWNTDPKAQRTSKFRSVYSREMLCNIDLFPEDDGDLNSSTLTDNNQSNLSAMASTASGVSMFTAAAGSGCQVDLSCGIQDSELPDRPQSSYSPRSLAIHPLGSQLACGDRTGRLRVYDLRTASLVQSTRAHAAEILTLNYSPPLVSVDGGENWTASTSAEEVPTSAPMVLLASAGRDRLVHIYDATANYSNINTLDNHSSSVTVAKFTSDGRRLVSCGGDKTMVFNSVNGRQICRMKSLQTPHGTINGLAIEATNKFAVSSGQDKKLNIWNVQIGKHLRAYKSESITSELYKCDIDPSGMFIAVCGFDKMIGIYDFFSGELIAQTSGHSELVTSVKFSPDGQYLVSIGGDSCIMMWKLSSVLVQAMQERLIELFSNAQKKNTKVVLRQSLTIEKSITKDDEQVGKASKDNKWAQRAEGGAYELFGRKIDPASNASNKNKFTLELTHAIVKDEVVVAAEIAEPVASERLAGGIAAVGNNFNNTAATIEALDNVNISELSDDDEDDDGNKLFKDGLDVLNLSTSKKDDDDDIYEPDFEREDRNTEDADLLHASTQVDKLEKTAQDLESWLETMLKSESKLADAAVAEAKMSEKKSLSAGKPDEGDNFGSHLNQSLSAAFFKKLTKSEAKSSDSKSSHDYAGVEYRGDNLLPPPELLRADAVGGKETSEGLVLEVKRRETAAAVSQMKERLRAMGILEATRKLQPTVTEKHIVKDDSKSVDKLEEVHEVVYPPPPPFEEIIKGKQNSNDGDEAYDTASTVSDDSPVVRKKGSASKNVANEMESQDPAFISALLKKKASDYKTVLRDLERAKKAAAASYQELMSMRESLSASVSASQMFGQASNNNGRSSTAKDSDHDLAASVAETDELLSMFGESFASLSETSTIIQSSKKSHHMGSKPNHRRSNTNTIPEGTEMTFGTQDSLEVSGMLEKYSDRLAELVSEKVLAKLSKN